MKPIVPLFIIAWFLSVPSLTERLAQSRTTLSKDLEEEREALYLPDIRAVKAVSVGFDAALSHILWLSTINYFGKHHRSDQSYRWLEHRCKLVQELNPGAIHAVEFCSLMLAWEAGEPLAADGVLSRAIAHHPDSWRLFYMRGINRLFFLKDEIGARQDLVRAAQLPGVHPGIITLASRQLERKDGVRLAIQFLKSRLAGTTDPEVRAALMKRLEELVQQYAGSSPSAAGEEQ